MKTKTLIENDSYMSYNDIPASLLVYIDLDNEDSTAEELKKLGLRPVIYWQRCGITELKCDDVNRKALIHLARSHPGIMSVRLGGKLMAERIHYALEEQLDDLLSRLQIVQSQPGWDTDWVIVRDTKDPGNKVLVECFAKELINPDDMADIRCRLFKNEEEVKRVDTVYIDDAIGTVLLFLEELGFSGLR